MKFAQNENPIIGLDLPEFDATNFDVTSFVEEYLDADKNNLIINCIGLMGAGASKRDPERFLNVNGIYVQKLIDAGYWKHKVAPNFNLRRQFMDKTKTNSSPG